MGATMFFSKQNNQSRWNAGPSDESIVAGIRAGERHLFEVLMRRHNQRLFRAVRALLKLESEVEDVMQQTYVDALANLSQLRGATSVSSWLVQIAVKEALDRLRQQRRFISSDTGFERMEEVRSGLENSLPADPEEATARVELVRLLEAAVDGLPAKYRVVFVLREIEGISTRDTSVALGVGTDVVKTRLRRAKLHIQRQVSSRAYASRARAFSFYAPRCDRVVNIVLGRLTGRSASNALLGLGRELRLE
jgi:RNA polymerase sigma-70 factor, ECF subfamily